MEKFHMKNDFNAIEAGCDYNKQAVVLRTTSND